MASAKATTELGSFWKLYWKKFFIPLTIAAICKAILRGIFSLYFAKPLAFSLAFLIAYSGLFWYLFKESKEQFYRTLLFCLIGAIVVYYIRLNE